MKVLASNIINRAKQLANIDNSNYMSFGELFDYLQAAYRQVYVDTIVAGDYNYLKEARLSGYGDYPLPDDFFQLAFIKSDDGAYGYGNELERDYDYVIKNGIIEMKSGCNAAVLGYYPTPDVITFKPKKQEIELPVVPISSWNTLVIDNGSQIYDFKLNEYVRELESPVSGSYILGENTYLDITPDENDHRNVYDFDGNLDSYYNTPILRTDGTFNEDIYETGHAFGWGNEDGSVIFTVNDGNLYYTDEWGTVLVAENYTPGLNAKVMFYNGDFCLVDLKRINYKDGSWETTDVPKAVVICKASLETGYGYLAKDGKSWQLTGFLPETKMDFPNNIFFDMMVYDLAIQFRRKVNMDTTDLQNGYDDRKGMYVATLSSDGSNFPVLRNVRNCYGHLSF